MKKNKHSLIFSIFVAPREWHTYPAKYLKFEKVTPTWDRYRRTPFSIFLSVKFKANWTTWFFNISLQLSFAKLREDDVYHFRRIELPCIPLSSRIRSLSFFSTSMWITRVYLAIPVLNLLWEGLWAFVVFTRL